MRSWICGHDDAITNFLSYSGLSVLA
jgi:hypothetical protein